MDQSVCAHLIEWFLGDLPAGTHKVKVAKNNGNPTNNGSPTNNGNPTNNGSPKNDRVEYEEKDYELKPWNYKRQKPRYIEWICKYTSQYDARMTIPLQLYRGSSRVISYYLDSVHLQ